MYRALDPIDLIFGRSDPGDVAAPSESCVVGGHLDGLDDGLEVRTTKEPGSHFLRTTPVAAGLGESI
jgi:hypothetical protein